jgi:hypothetical protein
MKKIISFAFITLTCLTTPLHAETWEEDNVKTKEPTAAGETPENGTATEEEKAPTVDSDPIIIKSKKKYQRSNSLDLTGAFGYNPTAGTFANNSLGLTFFAVFPSLDNGFLDGINDSFNLEAGLYSEWEWAGYTVIRHEFTFMPAVGGRWNFHLTPKWNIYAAARLGVNLDKYGFHPGGAGALGASWRFNEDMAFRFEMDTRHLFNFGVSFPY